MIPGYLLIAPTCQPGRTPHVREKGLIANDLSRLVGITPACAGKRGSPAAQASSQGDHPRVCGETMGLPILTLMPSGIAMSPRSSSQVSIPFPFLLQSGTAKRVRQRIFTVMFLPRRRKETRQSCWQKVGKNQFRKSADSAPIFTTSLPFRRFDQS